jgi:hypothetical protein
MPFTDYACPACGGRLHTDDLIEGKCVTPGCGESFPRGLGDRDDLPQYKPDTDDRDAPSLDLCWSPSDE